MTDPTQHAPNIGATIIGTVVPITAAAASMVSSIEPWLRVTALLVSIAIGLVSLHKAIRGKRD